MGVTGLWRLVEPSGNPIPLESIENKVLAVDVSIWLHQAIKGFHDSQGAPLPNAHLLGVFHRVCKLLYFRIKPVFIFDGGVPNLKKETISKRHQQKSKKLNEAERIQKQLLNTLLKHSAVRKILSEKTVTDSVPTPSVSSATSEKDCIFKLPPTDFASSDSEEESSASDSSPTKQWDLHTIDEKSPHFKALPADVRHEILTELKDTRKQSSWGRLHELPKQSDDFSLFQMKRLLKRYSVQVSLEEAEKEMGGRSLSLAELELLLKDQGVVLPSDGSVGNSIAADENTRYLLIKDVKKAMDEAGKQKKEDAGDVIQQEQGEEIKGESAENDLEFRKDLAKAIQLSLDDLPSTSMGRVANSSQVVFQQKEKLSSAKSYMMEYSGLTPSEIAKILNDKTEMADKKNSHGAWNGLQLNDDDDQPNVQPFNEIAYVVDRETEVQNNGNETSEDDDADADEDDFVEVSSGTCDVAMEENSTPMEIRIKPTDSLEDDLFKDVFMEHNISNPRLLCEPAKTPPFHDKLTDNLNEGVREEERILEPECLQSDLQLITNSETPNKSDATIRESTKENQTNGDKPPGDHDENGILTVQQLEVMEKQLRNEKDELVVEKLSKERMASNLTEQIYHETQDLLQLFGVPFIVAPMEAEAQCAFLDDNNLTDGTITDDSDIWLFGGKTVYKNFFNQHQHVTEFRLENIEKHFKINREQMILLALLVGSDYTVGIPGIGPVTALEVLAAFPATKRADLPNDGILTGLQSFRNWLTGGRAVGRGRTALRNKLKNVCLTESFPSLPVINAYLEPAIDSSKEPFSWAQPDVPRLVEFARQKFGWPRTKCEQILKPVLKRLNDTRIQKSIKDYFKSKHKIERSEDLEGKMSKRVKRAVHKIGQQPSDYSSNEEDNKKKAGKRVKNTPEDEDIETLKKTKVASKKRVEQIKVELQSEIDGATIKRPKSILHMHKKEIIPQKERDKVDALRSKMKAIEVYRKSKKGPGYVKKRNKIVRKPKGDAELSESSSSSE